MSEVVIAGAVRTAVGSFGGALKDIHVADLGAAVLVESLKRAGISGSEIEELILGNVLQGGAGMNPAR
jgi:acetyl-CoA C-acetyltransferase